MSKRAMKGLVAATLMGAASILGCADIINANFDRDVVGGGGSSGTGTTEASTTTTASTGSGIVVSYACSGDDQQQLKPIVNVFVFAKASGETPKTVQYFLSTRHMNPTGEVTNIGQYQLYVTDFGLESPVVLRDCPTPAHHITVDKDEGDCECLGYAATSAGVQGRRSLTDVTVSKKGDAYLTKAEAEDKKICTDYSDGGQCTPTVYFSAPK